MHQIHIYAAEKDFLSPPRLYRVFCSNRVVLLDQCTKIEAATEIGQLTNLEPVTHNVKRFPEQRTDLGILGDGIFTLR